MSEASSGELEGEKRLERGGPARLISIFSLFSPLIAQPQSRLEDLIHSYGVQTSTLQSTPSIPQDQRICFSDLSIGFSRRNVSIRLPFLSANSGKSLRKVAVSVERARDQRLEHTARQLVVRLGECQLTRREDDGLVWYE